MNRLAGLALVGAALLAGCQERREEQPVRSPGDLTAVLAFEPHSGQGEPYLREIFLEAPDGRRTLVVEASRKDELKFVGWAGDAALKLCASGPIDLTSSATASDGRRVDIVFACERGTA